MTLSKVIRAQDRVFTSQSGPRPRKGPELTKKGTAKITPKILRFALSGDPTAVTFVTNLSVFIK